MKIAVHITYYHSPGRLHFLNTVVEELQKLNSEPDIFIYTNKKLQHFSEFPNIKLKLFTYSNWKLSRIIKNYSIGRLLPRIVIHPFFLSWENRLWIEKLADIYDTQIYLEDDIHFKQINLDYWLAHKDLLIQNNYNLGFLRIERNSEGRTLMTDVNWPLKKVMEIQGQNFLINDLNPYCGFWIYDQKELKEFIISEEWKFRFKGYGIREKSAVGWHGKGMNRYKDTIIPLIKQEGKLITHPGSAVHHIANNYIGKGKYCTEEFPIEFQ